MHTLLDAVYEQYMIMYMYGYNYDGDPILYLEGKCYNH